MLLESTSCRETRQHNNTTTETKETDKDEIRGRCSSWCLLEAVSSRLKQTCPKQHARCSKAFLTLMATMHSMVLSFGTQEMAGATISSRLHFWYSASDLRHHLILAEGAAQAAAVNQGNRHVQRGEPSTRRRVSPFVPRHPDSTASRRVFMLDVLASRSAEQTEQEEDGAFIAATTPPP